MGYRCHHAIIVSTNVPPELHKFYDEALKLFSLAGVSPIMHGPFNATDYFMVGPDGSRIGWAGSDLYNERRTQFIQFIEATREEGGLMVQWVEVRWGYDGPEELPDAITRSSQWHGGLPDVSEVQPAT